jgi:hypothetical protein
MSIELLAMLGGGASGFLMKLIGAQTEATSRHFEMMLKKQEIADISHDTASKRGGVWVRRFIVVCVLFAVIVAPLMVAYTNVPVTVKGDGGGLLSFLGFGNDNWKSLEGFVLLPEVRQSMLAIVGFYFGSSQIK